MFEFRNKIDLVAVGSKIACTVPILVPQWTTGKCLRAASATERDLLL